MKVFCAVFCTNIIIVWKNSKPLNSCKKGVVCMEMKKGELRTCETISRRVFPEMRAFLVETSEKYNVGLGEAGRIAMLVAMAQAKAGTGKGI